jgi:hypothetical protein
MIDWFTTTITSNMEGLPDEYAIASHLGPQRGRCLFGMLWGGHPTGRAVRMQPTDHLRPRPPDRAVVASPHCCAAFGRDSPFDRLEFVASDAAKGISKAVKPVARARHDDPKAPTLEHGLEVFHTTMEVHPVLTRE